LDYQFTICWQKTAIIEIEIGSAIGIATRFDSAIIDTEFDTDPDDRG